MANIQRRSSLDHGSENATIRAQLSELCVQVDCVVTEYGVAELRGSTIRERIRKLIGIVHPKFRDGLHRQARGLTTFEAFVLIQDRQGGVADDG